MTHPNVFPLFNSRLRPFSRAHQMGPLGRASELTKSVFSLPPPLYAVLGTKINRGMGVGKTLWPDRKLFITRLASGAHGGANGLVPLLLASPHGPDTAIRIALGQRHAEECEMRKTLSGGFWTVSIGSRWDRVGCLNFG